MVDDARVRQLAAAVDALAAVDLADLPGSVVLAELEGVLRQADRLAGEAARRLEAACVRDETVAETGYGPGQWLQREADRSPAQARRLLGRARGLRREPVVAAELLAGRVPLHAADDLCRGLDRLPPGVDREEAREVLLTVARAGGQAELRSAVRHLAVATGGDDAAEAAALARYAQRHLDLVTTFEGTCLVRGLLDVEGAAVLRRALSAHSEPVGPEDERTPTQRRADALAHVAGQHLALADLPDQGGERPRVVVTIREEQLHGASGPATLDGQEITVGAARQWACDAQLLPVVLGTHSEVLDAGRTTRDWPVAIRRAAAVRSGGRCEAGTCDAAATVLHHVRFWVRDHGPTSLDNSAHLCAFHHWLVHRTAWTLRWQDGDLLLEHPPDATARQLGAKDPPSGTGQPWWTPGNGTEPAAA